MFSMMDFPHKSLQKYALDPVQSLLYSKQDLGHINGILTDRDVIEPIPGSDTKENKATPTGNKLTSNDLGFQKIRNEHKNMANNVESSKQDTFGSPKKLKKVSYPTANREPLPKSITSNSLPQRQKKAGRKTIKRKVARPTKPKARLNRQQSTKIPIGGTAERSNSLEDARRNFATNRRKSSTKKKRKTKRPSAFDVFFFKDAFDFGARALAKKLLHIDDSETGKITNETTPELIERLMDEENKRIDCNDENKEESKSAANDGKISTQKDAKTTKMATATNSPAVNVGKKDDKILPGQEGVNTTEQEQRERQEENEKHGKLQEKLQKVINQQEVDNRPTKKPSLSKQVNDVSLNKRLSQKQTLSHKSKIRDGLSLQNHIENGIENDDAAKNTRQKFEDTEMLNVIEEADQMDNTRQPPIIHQFKLTSIPKLKIKQQQTTQETTTVLATTKETTTTTIPTTAMTTTRMPTTKRTTTAAKTTTRKTTRITTTKPQTTSLPTTVAATTVAPTTQITTSELTIKIIPKTKKRTTTTIVPKIKNRALNSRKRPRRREIRTFKTPDWLLPPFGYRRPCPTRADAMFRSQSNKVYVIDGDMAYIIGRYGIESGPMHLRYLWSSAIGQVHDGYFRMHDHSIVLFYGHK